VEEREMGWRSRCHESSELAIVVPGRSWGKISLEKMEERQKEGKDTSVDLALRFALSAAPFGLRRASLRARSTTQQSARAPKETEKGDILNEVRKGTF
jgi:hypothetical protein